MQSTSASASLSPGFLWPRVAADACEGAAPAARAWAKLVEAPLRIICESRCCARLPRAARDAAAEEEAMQSAGAGLYPRYLSIRGLAPCQRRGALIIRRQKGVGGTLLRRRAGCWGDARLLRRFCCDLAGLSPTLTRNVPHLPLRPTMALGLSSSCFRSRRKSRASS